MQRTRNAPELRAAHEQALADVRAYAERHG